MFLENCCSLGLLLCWSVSPIFLAYECGEVSVRPFTPRVVSVAIRSTRNFRRSFPMSTVSIQLKHTQVSSTSLEHVNILQRSSRCLQLFCSIGSFSTTLFSARLALETGGQCGYQIGANFWSQSTAGLDQGGFTRGLGGRLYGRARPEGSTEDSMGGLDR